jgi:diacylglycerol kinase family enzyme
VGSVIIGGGDGTLNAVAAGLVDTGLTLGIIPLAYDLARTLDIPPEPAAAARIIAAGKVHPVDLGEVNAHLIFNVANIGFGVDLTRALTRESKRRFGPMGYAIGGLRAISRLRQFRAEIIYGPLTQAPFTWQSAMAVTTGVA